MRSKVDGALHNLKYRGKHQTTLKSSCVAPHYFGIMLELHVNSIVKLENFVAASDNPYVPGDMVKAKTGGPPMNVGRVYLDQVYTSWFSGTKLNKGQFHFAELEKTSLDDKKTKT